MIGRRLLTVPAAVIACIVVAAAAFAYFTSSAASGTGNATAGMLSAPAVATPTTDASTGAVVLSWSAATVGGTASGSVKYEVQRSTGTNTTNFADVSSGPCSGTLTTRTCTDSTSAGGTTYSYRVIAHYNSASTLPSAFTAGWSATSNSVNGTAVNLDTTPPTATITSASSATNTQPISFAITLSEPASSDLTASQVTVNVPIGNGIPVTGMAKTDSTHYTLTVSGLKTDGSGDGNVSVSIAAGAFTDAAGNPNTATDTTTVAWDRTAPAPAISSPTSNAVVLDNPAPVVSGTATTATGDASSVNVKIFNGTGTGGTLKQTFSNVAVTNGTWSVTPSALTKGNTYTAQATQTDSAGNSGTSTVTFTASPVQITGPAALGNGYVNSTNPTFSGTSSSNASGVTVTVYNGSTVGGTVAKAYTTSPTPTGSASPYSWSAPWTGGGGLTAGTTYTVRAQQVVSGTTYSSAIYTFTVDATPPAVSLTSPSANATTTGTPTFAGAAATASGDSTTVTVKVYSGATTGGTLAQTVTATRSSSSWAVASPGLASGQYTAQAEQTDAAGNTGSSAAITFTVDATPPSILSINRASATPTNAATVSWTVTFSEVVTGVDATDFSLSASGPTGAAISSITGTGATRTVTASAGSGDGSLRLDLIDDDSIVDGVGNKLGGTGAGNGNFTGQTYTVDRTAPAAPVITSPSSNAWSGASVTLSGTAEASSTVTVFEGSTSKATATTDSNGNWTATISAVTVGSHTYTAKATDVAGNQSGASNSLVIQVDTTAPTVLAAVIAKTEGLPNSTAGAIRQGGTYVVYANTADTGGSGLASVTADLTNVSGAGSSAVALHACSSACTVNNVTYGYVSDQQTAANPLSSGTGTFIVSASDVAGNTGNSGTGGSAKTVSVDNAPPTIGSIATANVNKAGTSGVIDPGDTITYAYSAPIEGISVLSSWWWSWGTAADVQARFTDGGADNDTLQIRTSDGSGVVGLGTIDLGTTQYVTGGSGTTVNFAATLSTNSKGAFVVTLGAKAGTNTGTLATGAASGNTITWTPGPSNPAYDVAGNLLAASPASATNGGAGNPKTQF